MKIAISSFTGVVPKLEPRYLPNGGAQIATNVTAVGKELVPLHELSAQSVTGSTSGFTLFRAGHNVTDGLSTWVSGGIDTSYFGSQLSGDSDDRYFVCGSQYTKIQTFSASSVNTVVPFAVVPPDKPLAVVIDDSQVAPANVTLEVPESFYKIQINVVNAGFKVSIDGGATFVYPTNKPTGLSKEEIATSLAMIVGLDAYASETGVTLFAPSSTGIVISVVGSLKELAAYPVPTGYYDTRVYTWTWIKKFGNIVAESAPAPPSPPIDVYTGYNVKLTSEVGSDYSGRRIYRSVNGLYLFVTESDNAGHDFEFVDDKPAEWLSEELPSTNWDVAPKEITGAVNLPNGMTAAFVGRDVYFCVPFRPYAWPIEYIQTVEYPVVGLGVIDTTLVVLTKGTPYFMQGGSPESITAVKSDLQQACVSAQSIVSINGSVFYASRDGLIRLSPSGSSIVTGDIISREVWAEKYVPSSILAFGYNGCYVAFNRSSGLGFVYDIATGNLTNHDVKATSGFMDIPSDKLFVRVGGGIKVWEGSKNYMTGVWRSKIFSFAQLMWFSCLKVEASSYNPKGSTIVLKCRVFVDGAPIKLDGASSYLTITSRFPYRLPVAKGKDWEIELTGITSPIFNIVLAQSMSEIASAKG